MGSKGSKGIQNRGPKLSELNRMAFKPRSSGFCLTYMNIWLIKWKIYQAGQTWLVLMCNYSFMKTLWIDFILITLLGPLVTINILESSRKNYLKLCSHLMWLMVLPRLFPCQPSGGRLFQARLSLGLVLDLQYFPFHPVPVSEDNFLFRKPIGKPVLGLQLF